MRRCAIYARYSSDLQRESSIEDQVRRCREFAARQGWPIVEEYVVADRAASGAAVAGRDGLQRLVEAAKTHPRSFDCLLLDDTSRLARDLSDALRMTDILAFHGVSIVSATQGIDSSQSNARQLLTISGMVDEQYLTGLRDKVHRGQRGRVLNGMIPSGKCFGYANVPIEDPSRPGRYGRPAVQSVRQEIIEGEAAVVRRIFEMSAGGIGLAQIATQLNRDGVPSPHPAKHRLRRAWSKSTVREMLHNERYRGVVIWGRKKKVRDPETGRKVSKARPQSEWTRVEVPDLRIIPEELWQAVQARNAQVNALGVARLGGMCRTQRSRTYLFSGLLVCAECGGSMVITSGGGRRSHRKYGCRVHKHIGVCGNNWTIRQDRLEAQLLAALEQRVLKPETIDYVVKRCQEELQRRLLERERQGSMSSLDGLRRQRSDLRLKAARLAEAIETGGDLPSLVQRLRTMEAAITKLDQAIQAYCPVDLQLTGGQIREHVLSVMMQLREVVVASDPTAAKSALRKHLGQLVLTPTVQDGRRLFKVSGSVNLAPDMGEGRMLIVPCCRSEPPSDWAGSCSSR